MAELCQKPIVGGAWEVLKGGSKLTTNRPSLVPPTLCHCLWGPKPSTPGYLSTLALYRPALPPSRPASPVSFLVLQLPGASFPTSLDSALSFWNMHPLVTLLAGSFFISSVLTEIAPSQRGLPDHPFCINWLRLAYL